MGEGTPPSLQPGSGCLWGGRSSDLSHPGLSIPPNHLLQGNPKIQLQGTLKHGRSTYLKVLNKNKFRDFYSFFQCYGSGSIRVCIIFPDLDPSLNILGSGSGSVSYCTLIMSTTILTGRENLIKYRIPSGWVLVGLLTRKIKLDV